MEADQRSTRARVAALARHARLDAAGRARATAAARAARRAKYDRQVPPEVTGPDRDAAIDALVRADMRALGRRSADARKGSPNPSGKGPIGRTEPFGEGSGESDPSTGGLEERGVLKSDGSDRGDTRGDTRGVGSSDGGPLRASLVLSEPPGSSGEDR